MAKWERRSPGQRGIRGSNLGLLFQPYQISYRTTGVETGQGVGGGGRTMGDEMREGGREGEGEGGGRETDRQGQR